MTLSPTSRVHVIVVTSVLTLALAGAQSRPAATQPALGWFQANEDVGKPEIGGSTTYDPAAQTYTMTAAGTNMWATRDEFQFAWRRLTGDFILSTHAQFVGAGVDPHRKMGWIVRRSLDPDSAYVDVAAHGDGLTSLQFRRAAGAITEQVESTVKGADVIQLERRGGAYIMSVAKAGDPFTRAEISDIDLGDEVYVGLFLCSHNPKVKEQATFKNVRIEIPPKAGWVPYRDYIGSNLELLTVETGDRTVIHTTPGSIQAPNWTRDGRFLIYNGGGRLYRFDLASRTDTVLDTGTVTSNNNDHVLSFDGRMLGISSAVRVDGANRSVIYTLPAEGGTPKRITANAPSYLHGWSLDGKTLVFTGQRNGELDIYKISADGGDEIRLTDAKGVDDGPEFSPDGQWIYFNSARTGRMQIWRMRPDGSNQEQLTNDEFNNWFPHPAPDGKSMVILSFGQDVEPGDHPFYRHVYIRLLKPDGSSPRVLAYLFGGQGTINVPSWSPDGKRIAFVSNSQLTAPH
jgi:TolB protein